MRAVCDAAGPGARLQRTPRCLLRSLFTGALVVGFAATIVSRASAETAATGAAASAQPPTAAPPGAPPEKDSPVEKQQKGRGFAFHPSRPQLNAFRLGLGLLFDAVDPSVMYGFTTRVPQITLDARYGLGAGWSLTGHLNTMLVNNELLLGGAYGWEAGRWSFDVAFSAGVYYGSLGYLAFDSQFIAGEYRPEVGIGFDFGDIALTVRGNLILMAPLRVRVGEVWAGLDNADAFTGHSEMIYVENTTRSAGVWYFGLGAMTTRSYYQMWILFPDQPSFYTYPRTVVGYEF